MYTYIIKITLKYISLKERGVKMKFIVTMSDLQKDEAIKMEIEAKSVFDAINIAAKEIENPEETELIEAYPVRQANG